MITNTTVARTWDLLGDLRIKDGTQFEPQKLWKRKIDERWTMAVNGSKERIENVPAFSIYVDFNGWPAGLIDTRGCSFAAGTLANLETFNEALQKALEAV